MYTVRHIRAKQFAFPEKVLSLTIILSPPITIAALILSGIWIKGSEGRFVLNIFWIPILFSWFPLSKYINTRFKDLSIVFAFALVGSYVIIHLKPLENYKFTYKPTIASCIDQNISEYRQETGLKVQHGIAQHWHSNLVNEFSKQDLHLVAVMKDLSPFKWINNSDHFRTTYDFAVVPHHASERFAFSRHLVEKINGKPTKVYTCDSKDWLAATLLIYGPGKLRTKKIASPGDQYTWRACELPTIIGEQTNDCTMRHPVGSKPGFLSYGPYERIPAGTYRFSISYSSDATTKTPVGFWDIVIFPQNEETVLSRGELIGTNADKEIIAGSFELGEA